MNLQLVEKIRECPTLPSLPAIALEVLDLAQKEHVDIAEIARVISRDPALSSKILRTVNSSFYGRSQTIATISHALVILGLQSVKSLVLGFSLVGNLKKTRARGFNHLHYWRRSVYAATAARILAARLRLVQQEECFLAALLMDIGMLVLDQVVGEPYGQVCDAAPSHRMLAEAEDKALSMTHADVAGLLAEQWRLPPVLAVPMASHHRSAFVADGNLRRLAGVVEVAGLCADVFADSNAAEAIAAVRQFCQREYGMGGADCDLMLEEIGRRTREVASLFEISITASNNYDAILRRANEALVEITLRTQQQAAALQQQNQQLRIQATQDPLTGLANRGQFDEFLASQFRQCLAEGQPLALLLVDVDHFKTINDTHGHQTGDQVLRVIGRVMRAAARAQYLAARYGGEELALVMPQTTRATAAATAESIRLAVSKRPISCPDGDVAVTVSVGVAAHEAATPFNSAAQLLKACDLALYAAKNAGRNCVKVFSLKASAAA